MADRVDPLRRDADIEEVTGSFAHPRGHDRKLPLFPSPWHYALFLGLASAMCLISGVWPLTPSSIVEVWRTAAGIFAAMALGMVLLGRVPGVRHVVVVVSVTTGAVLLAACQTVEGLVLTSLGLVVASQFAAYAYPFRQLRVVIPGIVVALTVGMLASPVPFAPTVWVVLVTTVAVSAGTFGYLLELLRWSSTTDDLTGALTRRLFQQMLEREIDQVRSEGGALCVVAVDLDAFKHLNDTHGHAAGDAALVRLVDSWRQVLHGRDAIARTGGDEFAVLLTEADEARGAAVVATVRALTDVRWSAGVVCLRSADHGTMVRVVGSAGGTEPAGDDGPVGDEGRSGGIPAGDLDAEALLARADDQLYRAKARDRRRRHDDAVSEIRSAPSVW